MRRFLPLLLVLWPLVELALLLQLGSAIGSLGVFLFIGATAVVGAALARSEGLRIIQKWEQAMTQGGVPAEGVLSEGLAVAGGVLLVLPGVLSDVAGLLLLVPFTRRLVAVRIRHYFELRSAHIRREAEPAAGGRVEPGEGGSSEPAAGGRSEPVASGRDEPVGFKPRRASPEETDAEIIIDAAPRPPPKGEK